MGRGSSKFDRGGLESIYRGGGGGGGYNAAVKKPVKEFIC